MTGHVDRRWSRWRLRADRRGEEGAIVVVFAAALVMIMVCVGFAVDLGNFTQRHQQTQDAADAAALSGAQQLGQGSSTSVVAASVENYVDLNDGYAPAPGSTVWDTCPASSIPTGFTAPAGSVEDCVTFGQIRSVTTNVIHVVIPPEIVDYTFGRAAGLSSVHISSAATAAAESPGSNFILPFGLGTSAEGGGYTCIKSQTPPNNSSTPVTCPNPSSPSQTGSGQEGLLISPRYRTFTGTSNSGSGNNATGSVDLAIGLDHELNVYPAPDSPTIYCDADSSPALSQCGSALPNDTSSTWDSASMVYLRTGGTGKTAIHGLVAGFTADKADPGGPFTFSPRLAHPDAFEPTGTNSTSADPSDTPAPPTLKASQSFGSSYTLNGRQVSWYLLNGWGSTGPPSLATTTFDTCFGSTNTSAPKHYNVDSSFWTSGDPCLAAVLRAATASGNSYAGGPIFSANIINSPRFGFVPVVCGDLTNFPNNCLISGQSAMAYIVGFEAVYLDAISVQGNVLAADAWVFSPQLIQSDPASPGAALGSYLGGPFVTNLCSLAAGNC